MARPAKEMASMSGDKIIQVLAAVGKQRNGAMQYITAPESRNYGGRQLWSADLRETSDGKTSYMRQVPVVQEGVLILLMVKAPQRADLEELDKVLQSVRFFQPSN